MGRRYSWPGWAGLDRRIVDAIGAARNGPGTFVEAGPNDGFAQSNTYALERLFGWTGVLVEPVPWLADLCAAFRPGCRVFRCALGASAGGQLRLSGQILKTTLQADGVVVAPVRTLDDVFDEAGAGEPDLLVLDVEGDETSVLSGLSLSRHAPRWIVVETAQPERVFEILAGRYKQAMAISHHDYCFERC